MSLFDSEEFDELYVVSDLHLGGEKWTENGVERNFQIFDQGELLEAFLETLSKEAEKKVGLVINGDTVDFLAEPDATYFDPEGAVAKLERIFRDPSFSPVWRRLKTFVKAPNRRLAITLGNHDLELALPWTRERLLQELADTDTPARARVTLCLDGAGYRCAVGQAKVLCVHGNEVDTWNVTDYEKLRRIRRDLTWGHRYQEWQPNAGTKLVIEVMNDIKKNYPFIDLLKPQNEAAIPVLLSLDKSLAKKLDEISAVALKLGVTKGWRLFGFLGAGEEAPDTRQLVPGQALATILSRSGGRASDSVGVLLKRTEERWRARQAGQELEAAESDEFLGGTSAAWAWFRGKPKPEILRERLDGLKTDRTFDLKSYDSWVKELDEQVDAGVHFLIAGHEHLERALRRASGRGYYFNSGTWVRLIQLTATMLSDPDHFARIYQAFEAHAMDALDQEPELVIRRPTVVCIWRDGNRTHGELRRAEIRAGEAKLEPVPNTRYTWG